MADRHVVMKQGMKELADSLRVSVTFMAKPDADQPGNSCHLHPSFETVLTTLTAAATRFAGSADARRLLGDTVIDHYGHHFAIEVAAADSAVTDWERRRYFERSDDRQQRLGRDPTATESSGSARSTTLVSRYQLHDGGRA